MDIAMGTVAILASLLPSQTATRPAPEVVPWVEVDASSADSVDDCFAGLAVWARTCTRAVVSVDVGSASRWFAETASRRPVRMRIVPGIKTSPELLRAGMGIDSVVAWGAIAQAADKAAQAAGSKVVLIENESAMVPYLRGEYLPDWDLMRNAVRQLPPQLEIWWYPSAAMSGETLQRYIRMALCVQNALGPRVRFVDHASLWGPQYVGSPGTLACVRELEQATDCGLIDLAYAHDGAWPLTGLTGIPALSRSDVLIIYPGRANWIAAGKAFGR